MNRGLIILLGVSLAANVFVGGLVVGRHFGGPLKHRGHHAIEMARGFGPAGHEEFAALSPAAREAFRKAFRPNREDLREKHAEMRRLRAAVAAAVAADPWERAAVEAALADLRAAEAEQATALSMLMIDAFEGLSAADRQALVKAMESRRKGPKGQRRPWTRGEHGPDEPPPPGDEPQP